MTVHDAYKIVHEVKLSLVHNHATSSVFMNMGSEGEEFKVQKTYTPAFLHEHGSCTMNQPVISFKTPLPYLGE